MLTQSFLMNSTLPTELLPLMLRNVSCRAIHPLLMTSFSTSLIFSPHLPSCFSPWTFIIWLLGCHTLVWPQELELLSKDKVTVRSFQRKAIRSDVSCLHWCGGLHGSGIWDFLSQCTSLQGHHQWCTSSSAEPQSKWLLALCSGLSSCGWNPEHWLPCWLGTGTRWPSHLPFMSPYDTRHPPALPASNFSEPPHQCVSCLQKSPDEKPTTSPHFRSLQIQL